MKLFGTDGIRGTANEFPMTPEIAMQVGRAIARLLSAQEPGKHRVVIGKDTRVSGQMLESALTAGLMSEGATVLVGGCVADSGGGAFDAKSLVRCGHYADCFSQSLSG